MPLEIRTQTVKPGDTAQFHFDGEITEYVVGVSYYSFTFGDKDHHVREIGIQLDTNKPTSSQLDVKAIGTLDDNSGNSIKKSDSKIGVVALAWTGAPTTGVTLANERAIANGTSSAGISLPSANPYIDQAMVSGFDLAFEKDHHVRRIEFGASVSTDGSVARIDSTAKMIDNSGNSATKATIDGGLLSTASASVGAVLQTTVDQQTKTPFEIYFDTEIAAAAVLMTNFTVEFSSGKDHHVKKIGGGCSGWSVGATSPNAVRLDDAHSFVQDNSGNSQKDDLSGVSLMVVGIAKTPTTE